jgi:hypothetical protein
MSGERSVSVLETENRFFRSVLQNLYTFGKWIGFANESRSGLVEEASASASDSEFEDDSLDGTLVRLLWHAGHNAKDLSLMAAVADTHAIGWLRLGPPDASEVVDVPDDIDNDDVSVTRSAAQPKSSHQRLWDQHMVSRSSPTKSANEKSTESYRSIAAAFAKSTLVWEYHIPKVLLRLIFDYLSFPILITQPVQFSHLTDASTANQVAADSENQPTI